MKVLLYSDMHDERLGASYLRAFRALGHEVACFDVIAEQRRLAAWLRTRVGHRLTINSLVLRRMGSETFNHAFLQAAAEFGPEVVLVISGHFLMPESVRKLRRSGAKVAAYFPDNPNPPHSASRPEILLAAAECDLYLVWGERLAEELRSRAIPGARFLPFGWDGDCFPFQGAGRAKEGDVVFVGGWDPQRETFLDEVGCHFRLQVWGPPYWGSRTRPGGVARRAWQGRELNSREFAAVSAAARINLNILREQHMVGGQPDGVIMRNFEVPGAGGFLLSTRSATAERLFPERHTGAYYQDVSDCLTAIERHLAQERERNELAALAHEEVDRRHRFTHRASEILSMLRDSG